MFATLEVQGEEVVGVPGQNLTTEELRALVATADGLPSALLATSMQLDELQVRHLERSIQAKLGAKNKAHMITRGFTLGVLMPQALCLCLCVISALELDHDFFRQRSQRRTRTTQEHSRLVKTSPAMAGSGRPTIAA
jgi:DNA-binding CsgD family transcriptional regulator